MKNYIKPSANVIELAVKETLSRAADRKSRSYRIKIGNSTYSDKDINTNVYTASGVSKIRWSDEQTEA